MMGELGRLTPFADMSPPPPAPGEPVMASRVVSTMMDVRSDRYWAKFDNGLELELVPKDFDLQTGIPHAELVRRGGRLGVEPIDNPLRAIGIYLGLHQ
jgi:hypothetical protein